MHFLLTWGVPPGVSTEQAVATRTKIVAILAPFQSRMPLGQTHIVQVGSQADWEAIKLKLVELSKIPPFMHFVMTPIMVGGRYDGALPPSEWTNINILTG